ncbi:S26 family signal peptidase [Phenylobacterium sp. LjRoot225]|uniref:S26 family signal peptidase n=1 Tax=Phenylobacterium sp. LjRoot225 TaxID=3342285 RepID=UPI003ED0FDB2
MSSSPSPNSRRRRFRILVWSTAPVAVAAAVAVLAPHPSVLWNASDSEPQGLYVRTPETPRLGRVIAFKAPASVFPYAERRMDYLHRIPILKQIGAAAGDRVCTLNGELRINDRRAGPVYAHDRYGGELPRWIGCRRLAEDEFFVFSDRIPNSFDSRYYGPLRAPEVVGVFRPVFTLPGRPGAL